MKKVYLYSAIALVILLGVGLYFLVGKESNSGIACTMDAKICPDGSAVGRTGPDCDFEKCPGIDAKTSMVMRTDDINKITFLYPEQFGATYITPAEWPPKISIAEGKLSCAATQRIIGSTMYCVKVMSEGAAGSVFEDITYLTQKSDSVISANVVLQKVGCLNYNDSSRIECQKERSQFNLDPIMDSIISSVKEVK